MSVASHEPGSIDAHASRELLAARVEQLPDVLRATLAVRYLEVGVANELQNFVVTGIGGSEGPARIIAAALRRFVGVNARYVPMSALLTATDADLARREVLVLVSHGLCPNARNILAQVDRFAASVLLSSRERTDVGTALHTRVVAPEEESGLLVRVLAPPAATLAGLAWVADLAIARGRDRGVLARLDEVPAAVERVLAQTGESAIVEGARVGLLSCGDDGDAFVHGLRWKWLEALGRGDPPCWDALGFAHGPFQDLWNERAVLWALLHEDVTHERELIERLASILHAGRHRLVQVVASLPSPLGWFEHDAWFDRLVLRELAEHPRDLANWPGKGRDGALYGW